VSYALWVEETQMQVLSVARTSTLLGNDVVNSKGESLAQLNEIVLDVSAGKIAYAVPSLGGVLGIGGRLLAIPWEALRREPENRRLVLDLPHDKLAKAPSFHKNDWPDMSNPEWGASVYGCYGYRPYWES